MATTQAHLGTTVDSPESSTTDENTVEEREIDILGCGVDGCAFSTASIVQLYCHYNVCHGPKNHDTADAYRKQKAMVDFFCSFEKERREHRATSVLRLPF